MSKSEKFTVHDWEGLDTLPVGTKLVDVESDYMDAEVVEVAGEKGILYFPEDGGAVDRAHRESLDDPFPEWAFIVKEPKKAGLTGPWYAGDPELHGTLLVDDSAPGSVLCLWFYNAHNDSWSCGEWTDEYDCGPENALSEQGYPSSYQGSDAGASGVIGRWGLADVSDGYRTVRTLDDYYVGQRVRVNYRDGSMWNGPGEVTAVDRTNGWVIVDTDSGRGEGGFYPKCLEPLREADAERDNTFVELLTSLLEHAYDAGYEASNNWEDPNFADWIKEKLAA